MCPDTPPGSLGGHQPDFKILTALPLKIVGRPPPVSVPDAPSVTRTHRGVICPLSCPRPGGGVRVLRPSPAVSLLLSACPWQLGCPVVPLTAEVEQPLMPGARQAAHTDVHTFHSFCIYPLESWRGHCSTWGPCEEVRGRGMGKRPPH